MTRSLLTVSLVVLLAQPAFADGASVYRWRDATGGLHFSNRADIAPESATPVDLPALSISRRGHPYEAAATASPPRRRATRSAAARASCAGDGRAPYLARAVVRGAAPRIARAGQEDSFTLLVDGEPVLYGRDTLMQHVAGVDHDDRRAVLGMAALAYPDGVPPCRGRPALERYAVSAGRRHRAPSLCDDYRRTFAEVGVAVSRDHGVAQSFRAIAASYAETAARGYVAENVGVDEPLIWRAGPRWPTRRVVERRALGSLRVEGGAVPSGRTLVEEPWGVALPPWLVDGHIAQTAALADETEAFVEELAIALEEIDLAAQRAGCW
jgi:hypothetical protein